MANFPAIWAQTVLVSIPPASSRTVAAHRSLLLEAGPAFTRGVDLDRGRLEATVLALGVASGLFGFVWDVKMDWGLCPGACAPEDHMAALCTLEGGGDGLPDGGGQLLSGGSCSHLGACLFNHLLLGPTGDELRGRGKAGPNEGFSDSGAYPEGPLADAPPTGLPLAAAGGSGCGKRASGAAASGAAVTAGPRWGLLSPWRCLRPPIGSVTPRRCLLGRRAILFRSSSRTYVACVVANLLLRLAGALLGLSDIPDLARLRGVDLSLLLQVTTPAVLESSSRNILEFWHLRWDVRNTYFLRLQVAEVARRAMWSVFRVEYEVVKRKGGTDTGAAWHGRRA